MSNVSEWNVAASSNTSAPPNGAPEGMAPSTVNNTMREMMAALARWYQDANGSLETGGTSNAYTLTTNNGHAALADQSLLVFRADRANTGAATLNVDGLGAKSIRYNDAALISGQIVADMVYIVAYNATDSAYDLIGPNNSATSLTVGTLPDARLSANIPRLNDNAVFTDTEPTIDLKSSTPMLRFTETDAAINGQKWEIIAASGSMIFRARTDDDSSNAPFLTVERTGIDVTLIEFQNANLQLSSPSCNFFFEETDAGTDEKLWKISASSAQWALSTRTDADGVGSNIIEVERTGTTVDTVNFPSGELQYGGIEVATVNTALVWASATQNGGAVTFSTLAASGTPAAGDIWIQHEA